MNQAVRQLEAVFNEIAETRMAGLPVVNPALRVEAIGFREWQGRWLGVLVTPWFINLVLLPGREATLLNLGPDEKAGWDFPSGSYEFIGLNEPAIGTCHICPLISPLAEFAAHEAAQAVAREIMLALFDKDGRRYELAAQIEEATQSGAQAGRENLSRRDFLRMPFGGR